VNCLISVTGKKQSGKDSLCSFVQQNAALLFPKEHGKPFVRRYYFASPMRALCEDYLDIHPAILWGSDAEKNLPTHLFWEDLPLYPLLLQKWQNEGAEPKTGLMSGREVLQFVGENLLLSWFPDVWLRKFRKAVQSDNKVDVGLNPDIRKPEQVFEVKKLGGKVIRLTRAPYPDNHISETALDQGNFDWVHFDAVLDNANMDLLASCLELVKILQGFGWVGDVNLDLLKLP
jgi:hypothetical protein